MGDEWLSGGTGLDWAGLGPGSVNFAQPDDADAGVGDMEVVCCEARIFATDA